VIVSGGGAAARAGEANTVPSANPVAPWSISRLESFWFRMGLFVRFQITG